MKTSYYSYCVVVITVNFINLCVYEGVMVKLIDSLEHIVKGALVIGGSLLFLNTAYAQITGNITTVPSNTPARGVVKMTELNTGKGACPFFR